MKEVSLSCQFKPSVLNPELYVCDFCRRVVSKQHSDNEIMCPQLLHKYALNEEYPQIKLVSKQEMPAEHFKNLIKPSGMDQEWWDRIVGSGINVKATIRDKKDMENRKQCSQEQIDARLAICNGCEFYQNNTCLKCGCALSREKNYKNKLLWADQKCPVDKWGPITS